MGDERSRRLRWLHRTGYVTTVIVAAELLFVAVVGGREWMKQRRRDLAQVEETRTREGPLPPVAGDEWVRPELRRYLRLLPSTRALGANSLRFVAAPSFGRSDYAVAARLKSVSSGRADGFIVVIEKSTAPATIRRRAFSAPASSYRRLIGEMGKLTDGYRGEVNGCLDGTPAGYEMVRDGRMTSGAGNCEKLYDEVKLSVLRFVRSNAPGLDLPTEDDWHRFEPGDN